MKILYTDLDGTLLDNEWKLSPENRATLISLQQENIIRVIVTGRSLYSTRRLLPDDFPIDYLIFSTGAGIIDWHSKELISAKNIPGREVRICAEILTADKTNFMLHKGIPESHLFYYYEGNYIPDDFHRRLNIYSGLTQPFDFELHASDSATQFLSMLTPERFATVYENLRSAVHNISIIKTTSPLLSNSLWLEIYAPDVTKGHAAEYLARRLGVRAEDTMAIGNDFNDIDMLEWSSNSYVVANAPEELRKRYICVAPNSENGFREAVRHWMAN